MTKQTNDMRSLPQAQRIEKRRQVIHLREAGLTYDEIAAKTQLSRTGVFDICKRHATTGDDALRDAVGGRKEGEGRRLTHAQEVMLLQLMTQRSPDALALTGKLWTQTAVAELIAQQLEITLPARTLALYLSRWGCASQRPLHHLGLACSSSVNAWLIQEYTAINRLAKTEKGRILWLGQMPLPQGSPTSGLTLLFTESNKAEVQWQIYETSISPDHLIDFLGKLLLNSTKKLLVITPPKMQQPSDQISTYCTALEHQTVSAWLHAHADRIVVFRRPAATLPPGASATSAHTLDSSRIKLQNKTQANPARTQTGMTTIKDVARRAGVTPMTVSNVLRDRAGASAATRELVLQAAAQEGYRPNLTARALVERRAPTLGLMLSSITNPFYPEFALEVNLAAHRHNRFLLMCNTNHETDGGSRFLHEVAGSLAQGILVANQPDLPIEELKGVAANGTPVVVCIWEHPDQSPGIPCVSFDARRAGEIATEHLLALGHRTIGALIANPRDGIHRGRYRGFLDALETAKVAHQPDHEHFCDDTIDDGYRGAMALLTAQPGLSAIFVSNDLPAIGALNAAAAMGLQVPRDLSVVSITNIQLAQHTRPPLTTVALPTAEIAMKGVDLLLQLIANSPAEAPMICTSPPVLIERGSTAAYSTTTVVHPIPNPGAGTAC